MYIFCFIRWTSYYKPGGGKKNLFITFRPEIIYSYVIIKIFFVIIYWLWYSVSNFCFFNFFCFFFYFFSIIFYETSVIFNGGFLFSSINYKLLIIYNFIIYISNIIIFCLIKAYFRKFLRYKSFFCLLRSNMMK